MKKVYAINGSPRTNRNTATLLDKALEGAKSVAADVIAERIDLYKLKYTVCRSCFACKVKNGKFYGRCAIHDDLYEILEKLRNADAIIFGSPIYYRTITGQLHAFYERFFFPYMQYKVGYPNLDKYVCEVFSGEEKSKYRDEHFPQDCQRAFDLGKNLINS